MARMWLDVTDKHEREFSIPYYTDSSIDLNPWILALSEHVRYVDEGAKHESCMIFAMYCCLPCDKSFSS